jgi:TonB dependent receptor
LSAIKGPFSGSLGQFHYETSGIHQNNDVAHDIYNAFAQFQVTPDLSIQAELRRRRTQNGDLGDIFSVIEELGFNPDLQQKLEQDSQRFGFHYRPARNHDIITSYHHIESDFAQTVFNQPDNQLFTASEVDSQNVDVRYQVRTKHFQPIFGFSYLDGSRDQLTIETFPELDPETEEPIRDDNGDLVLITDIIAQEFRERFITGYFYLPFHFGRSATFTLGISADHIKGAGTKQRTRLNPKVGLIWSLTDYTTLRLAFFRTLKRQFWARQTLEPTHLGGFNQIFDDLNGTEATRYGVGLDHRFSDSLLAGIEVSWRDLSIPLEVNTDGDESIYRAYLNWLPNQSIALGAQYYFEELTTVPGSFLPVHGLSTHQIPLSVRYYHPTGMFARSSERERFWNIDAAVGYRLPKRLGIIAIEMRNLLDEDFQYLSGIIPKELRQPPFIADRAIFGKINLWFY